MPADTHWLPLESNPEYARALGLGDAWQYTDIFGLDPELLAMTPEPVVACLLLFPVTAEQQAARGAHVDAGELDTETDLFFCKQTISNACGTIGMIHSIAAGAMSGTYELDKQKPLKAFLEKTKGMTPQQRGECLKQDKSIQACHATAGHQGQTDTPDAHDEVDLHFIAFVQHKGFLYELDGNQSAPIRHQSTSSSSFLQDCARVVQAFIDRDPDNVNFNLIALCAATGDE